MTLEKFFSYIAEELKIGKSKSALQLSAMDDVKRILDEREEDINRSIKDYLCNINIEEELDKKFLEIGEEHIDWNISDVSVEKEQKNITYYINLDINVLADLIYKKDEVYQSDGGKAEISLTGRTELVSEEYSTIYELKALNMEKKIIYTT